MRSCCWFSSFRTSSLAAAACAGSGIARSMILPITVLTAVTASSMPNMMSSLGQRRADTGRENCGGVWLASVLVPDDRTAQRREDLRIGEIDALVGVDAEPRRHVVDIGEGIVLRRRRPTLDQLGDGVEP